MEFESHSPTYDFMTSLGTSFFQPYILQPTRITDHSATLIDNIFFNSLEHFTISGNIIYDLTDHLPNFLILNKFSLLPTNVEIFRRDYSKLNESCLVNDIQSVNWHDFLSANNPSSSTLFDIFYTKLSVIMDKHIPVKQLSKRELKIQSKVKNEFYKKYLKTKSPYYHSKFKFYRNKLNHLLRISKRNYYSDYSNKNTNNGKLIWKGIKQIIRVNPKTYQTPVKIIDNNREITDKNEIANILCGYFSNIGEQLASAIPNVNKSPLDYMATSPTESFYVFPATSQEIEDEISKLNHGKGTGLYSIPVKILKIIKYVISKPLSFKIAKIIPVHKGGSQSCLNNYRPISLFLYLINCWKNLCIIG